MTDLDALVRAILEHPDDDTPRLIYADALEDVGESDRAALIRAQVELARVPDYDPIAVRLRTSEAYRDQCGAAMQWLIAQELPQGLQWALPPFRRGFPAAIQAENGAAFVSRTGSLFSSYPIEELELRVVRLAEVGSLAGCGWLNRIVRLTVIEGLSAQVAHRLFESANLGRLTELTIGAGLTTTSAAAAIIRSRAFGKLTAFACHTDRGRPVINELAQLDKPPRLTKLDVSSNQMTAERMTRLGAAPVMSGVEELDLSDNNNLGHEGARAVAAARLPQLRTLRMLQTRPRDDGVEALAMSDLMAELRSLHLGRNNLGPPAVAALGGVAAAGNLRVLDLTDNRLGDDGATTLAESPHLRNLILLDLAENLIEDRGAHALADSPHLDGLIHLNLSSNVISPDAAKRLRKRFGDRVLL